MWVWYVYVDWTKEEVPRPFYVGKGNSSRVLQLRRNKKHSLISEVYGIRREVVRTTKVEKVALNTERKLILKHLTYAGSSEIGCNFTHGGQGTSGHHQSPEARQKIREAHLGLCRPHTEATKHKMSLAKKGKPPNNKGKSLSLETRQKMSLTRRGKPKSEAWKNKIGASMMGNRNGKRKVNG
jgi:hypothetical protein